MSIITGFIWDGSIHFFFFNYFIRKMHACDPPQPLMGKCSSIIFFLGNVSIYFADRT